MQTKPKQNKEYTKSKLPENTITLRNKQNLRCSTMALDQTIALHRTRGGKVRPLPRELRTAHDRCRGKNSTRNERRHRNPKKNVSVCI